MPSDPPFTMVTRTEDGTLLITFTGELDITNRQTLAEQLSQALAQPPAQITYDLTNVPYLDVGTACLLIRAVRDISQKPVLIRPAPLVVRLLQILGLDHECSIIP